MRKGFRAVLACWLATTGLALAQDAPPPLPAPAAVPTALDGGAPPAGPSLLPAEAAPGAMPPLVSETHCAFPIVCDPLARFWGGGDYLLWWVKDGPLPLPLVTTGDTATFGILGNPGTRVLFGNQDLDYSAFSGMRLTAGMWLDSDQLLGLEASSFLLEQRAVGFRAGSDLRGNPVLSLPFQNAVSGNENVILITTPASAGFVETGGISIASASRLWGAEANALLNVRRRERFTLDLLAGFRYLDLTEDLNVKVSAFEDFGGGDSVLVAGADRFATRSQFYGGQVGARTGFRYERLTLDLTGKLALGGTHQVVDIGGGRSQLGTGTQASFLSPGFVYALPTNMGRYWCNQFTVVPELQLKVGYDVTRNLRVSVGYEYLYWSEVVRPGDQIDRVLNISQRRGNPLTGVASPLPVLSTNDFWAHGLNFGLEFRY